MSLIVLLQRILGVEKFLGTYAGDILFSQQDGTIEVMLDDEDLRARGMSRVRAANGCPEIGAVLTGGRCLVEFEGGNPDAPYVVAYDDTALAAVVTWGDDGAPMARDGDSVECDIGITSVLTGIVSIPSPTVAAAIAAGSGSVTTLPPFTPFTLTGLQAKPTCGIVATQKKVLSG